MHKVVHLFFAARVARQMAEQTGVSLCRLWFAYGNIRPDLTLSMCVTPHTASDSLELLRGYVDELHAQPMHIAEFSKKLGIAMHYVCDYFCHAHGTTYRGGLLRHIAYELRMVGTLFRLGIGQENGEAEYAEPMTGTALTAALRAQADEHTAKVPSPLGDVAAALSASRAFCLDALRRWCALSAEPAFDFDYEETENAVAI